MPKDILTLPSEQRVLLERAANLLEQASTLIWEISQGVTDDFTPSIPELKPPKHVPQDEAWFWSKDWQAGEREVNEDLQTGRYKVFKNVDDLLTDLDTHV